MRSRPLIGVSGPDTGGILAWLCVNFSIRRAGGKPVRITPDRGVPKAPLDGLVLGGGADVADELTFVEAWQSERKAARGSTAPLMQRAVAMALLELRVMFGRKIAASDKSRDRLEVALLHHMLESELPVLGICRGAQLINVVKGGTLHRDLSSFYVERPNPHTVLPRKRVIVEKGSRLAQALGVERCIVNSLHKNSIDRVATGLRVVAREENGVVQAVEDETMPFVIGVQWHPEYLPQRREQILLFQMLVEQARSHREVLAPASFARVA